MLTWGPEFATGNEAIDHQHRRLFEFVNRLEVDLEGGGLRPEHVDFLVNYVEVHFASEELCMFRHVCPRADQNKSAHQAFLRRIRDLADRPALGSGGTALVTFLQSWIRGHILGVDRSISECVDTDESEWPMTRI